MHNIRWLTLVGLLFSACITAQSNDAGNRPNNGSGSDYWDKVEELNRKARQGMMMFPNPPQVDGKDLNKIADLCMYLVDRHNGMPVGGGLTNGDYLGGVTITVEECINALSNPAGYAPGDWNRWKGRHDGKWTNDDGQMFEDDAEWGGEKAGERDYGDGGPDDYREQPVTFGDGREGYNGSSSDKDFVWGWDPKDDGSLDKGVHVGYPFNPAAGFGLVTCILWVTPTEAFLECVFDSPGAPNGRTSTGLWGKGQWEVGPLDNQVAPLPRDGRYRIGEEHR
ncbi:MAG: hypothetical protein Tsb002_08860 [Wenzhouxiangellaceae bacterium]